MAKRLDLTNDVYGDFTVIEMLYGYKYINNKPRTYCRCIGIDGNEYIIRADALRSGATKHINNVGQKMGPKDLTNQKFGHLIAKYPTDRRSNNGNIIWHCLCDCGNKIDVSASNLIRGHTRSCGHKHRSKYEEFIGDYLKSIGINYLIEYRFEDCKNSGGTDMLPFDFYLYDFNSVIEFDGMHHYEPVSGWGGVEKFNKTKENDRIKDNYCNMNNINILRIPYTFSDEEIVLAINTFLSPVTITA